MILYIILTLFLGMIGIVDKILGSFVDLTNATITFYSMLNYVDISVYYVRSILPVTISNLFRFAWIVFNIGVIIFILSVIKSKIPFMGKKIGK
jgi:hypothetical protein